MTTVAGTPYFMPPEVIKGSYSLSCDLWSLGCVFYLLVTGHLPFMGKTRMEVFEKIQNGNYTEPTNCSQECCELISLMLQVDPKKRMPAQQCLDHEWFKKIHAGEIENNKGHEFAYELLARLKRF